MATDPVISVPYDINKPEAMRKASLIERFLKAAWFGSGRIAGNPVHHDVVLSALLYGECIIGINSTKEMAKLAGSSPGLKRRMEAIAERTPFIFEALSPMFCYIERSQFGPTAFYQRKTVRAGVLMDKFGANMEKATAGVKKRVIDRDDDVTYNDLMDLDVHVIWIDESETPLFEDENKLPLLPVASQIAEGPALFDKEEEKREPFLYTLSESKLLERENMLLTVLYTMAFSIGSMPMFVDYTLNPENPPVSDFSEPGGTIHYRTGERREIMAKQVIDPSLLTGWEIAKKMEEESTIFHQTLGEPLGQNAPYSMVALLSQAGRLPLLSAKKKAGWCMGEAMEIALQWAKISGKETSA